ncbi:TonB-dependent siderophore receptor [Nitratifractor sp.]|uniref:TonB-dependent receptor plug domain-containing protein n=1 Tax=Nitratifractor sp. TaxID=2268144 RepID=UPI0025D2DF0B|nr:TonB-dependent receptor [Nitratifractor sp.]
MNRRYLSLLTAALLTGALQASPDNNTTADLDELGIITVTPDRVSEPLKNSTANVTVITAKEIQQRGYQTLADALSRLSGFSTYSNGGPGQTSGLFLRGFNSGNILIMLDGVPLKDPTDPSFSTGLAHLRLDDVARIEVVKGAQSGLWGADAVAGVINIITKSASPGGHVSLRGGYGSYNSKTGGITLSASGEAGSFYLSGDHFKTDGFSAQLPRDAEDDGYTNDTLHFKGTLHPTPNSTWGVFYHKIQGDFDYDSTGPDDSASNGTFDDSLIGLSYDYDAHGDFALHAMFSSNTIDRQLNDAAWGPSRFQGQSERGTLRGVWRIDNHQRLSGGVEYNRIEGTTPFANSGNAAAYDNRAVYGNYRYIWDDLLGARTIVDATLRYDDFSAFDNKATYRFGLKRECNLLPGLFTAANLYSAYKAPSIYQWTKPKPGSTLKPEYTHGFEISAGYEDLIKLTYFRSKITDRLIPGGSWPNDYYYNGGADETHDGIEIEGHYNITALHMTLGANYTHLFTLTSADGSPLIRVPRNEGNLFLDYAFSPAIHLGANLQYVGKRADQHWVGWTPTNVTLGSYTLVNLSYNQQIGKNLTLSIQAHNIFDKDYQTADGYSTEGRSIYGKVEYKF